MHILTHAHTREQTHNMLTCTHTYRTMSPIILASGSLSHRQQNSSLCSKTPPLPRPSSLYSHRLIASCFAPQPFYHFWSRAKYLLLVRGNQVSALPNFKQYSKVLRCFAPMFWSLIIASEIGIIFSQDRHKHSVL